MLCYETIVALDEMHCCNTKYLKNQAYLNCMQISVPASQITQPVSTTKTKKLMMFEVLMAVYCKKPTKQTTVLFA